MTKYYYGPEVSTDETFMRTFKSSLPVHNVKIPKKIMKRVKEGNKNQKYVTLSCSVKPGRLWGAWTVGTKLSFGWEKFAKDNSFVDGDLLLFKYNGRTRFHVECFSSIANTVDLAARGNKGRNRTNSRNTHDAGSSGNSGRNRQNSHNAQETAASGNERKNTCTVTITADKIVRSRMYHPTDFCTSNGLEKFGGKEIAMVGEDGTSFPVKLKTMSFTSRKRFQLQNGLREFFEENDINTNDQIAFELLYPDQSLPKLKLRSKVILVPN